MLGTYLGQFLPLSGGSNFPMTGALSLNANGINFDSTSDIGGDGNGNVELDGATVNFYLTSTDANAKANNSNAGIQIDNNWTLSGTNASTDLIVNRNVVSGSSTGTQYLLDLQLAGTSKVHVDTAGTMTLSGSILASTGTVTSKGFLSPTFLANTTVFVDGTNGNDSSGNGSQTNPYKTVTKAASLATSGNLIFVGAGTFTSATQIVLASGVSLKGSGVDVTILQPTGSWTAGLGTFIVFGNNSAVSELTIDLTASSTTNRPHCIGADDIATGGSTQFGLNPSMRRVKCKNTASGLYYISSLNSTSTSYLYLEDCIFISNSRCAQWSMDNGGTVNQNFSADAYRCQFLFTYSSSVSNSGNGECAFAQAALASRFFDCVLSMTDTTNTSWSGLGYQTVDADAPVEFYGSHILTNFPNLPAASPTTTSGSNPGWWAFSNTLLTKLGAGCTINPQISDIGHSLYQTLPSPAPHYYLLNLAVSSSTVTPWGESGNNLFETAVDAGTLSSSTLTIANVNVSANTGGTVVAAADCQKMRLRIKNTNASSTAMTLAFGTGYDTSAFTVGTIAAGKKAYLDFTYDADNSKWDLTGFVNGV